MPNDTPADDALQLIDTSWIDFQHAWEDLSDDALLVPGVTGDWSVRDILAHVTAWEEETLAALPIVAAGQTPVLYSTMPGGIDRYNAELARRKVSLSLDEVRQQLGEVHARLREYVSGLSPELLDSGTRFRERLAGDTWEHYPEHAFAIRAWRAERG